MAKCWKCGTIYHSNFLIWHGCPSCSLKEKVEDAQKSAEKDKDGILRDMEKQKAEIEDAIEDAECEMEEALQRATEEQMRLAVEGWKLEAQSKVERAQKLLNARLYSEASDLSQKAMKEDPGNLYGYLVFSLALRNLGDDATAVKQWNNAVRLLGLDGYNGSDSYVSVLATWPFENPISEDIALFMAKLKNLAEENPSNIDPWLIKTLAQIGLTDVAILLAKNVALGRIYEGLLKSLLETKSPQIALILAERMATDKELIFWFRGLCWLFELRRKAGIGGHQIALRTISSWTPADGTKMIQFLKENKLNLRNYSSETTEDVKRTLADIYKRFRSEILRSINKATRKYVTDRILFCLEGWWYCLIYLSVIVFIGGAILSAIGLNGPERDAVFLLVILVAISVLINKVRHFRIRLLKEEGELLEASGLSDLFAEK